MAWHATANETTTPKPGAVTVDGNVALHALMSLADGHLQKIAGTYAILAKTQAVRSGQWGQIREKLAAAARINVPALYWYALPDGSYWTLQKGHVGTNLAHRDYFPKVLAGQTILGNLVVSKATGKSAAIVAVPVYGKNHKVIGVLGASVYLDRLSKLLGNEMHLGPNQIFYSLDKTPIVGVHRDPHAIFVHPLQENDPQLTRAVQTILSHDHGMVHYQFRGVPRTVYFQKSPVTGWSYAFGVVHK